MHGALEGWGGGGGGGGGGEREEVTGKCKGGALLNNGLHSYTYTLQVEPSLGWRVEKEVRRRWWREGGEEGLLLSWASLSAAYFSLTLPHPLFSLHITRP